jgi:hypothetical protein
MRSLLGSALAGVLLLVPGSAFCADLTFTAEGFAEYDDNAFRDPSDEEDDVLFRLSPAVRIHEDRGEDARYSLQYAVPFEFAVDNGDRLDDIDHNLTGRITYHINDRVEAFGTGALRYLRSGLRQTAVEDPAGSSNAPLVNTERERILITNAETGMTYSFSPRMTGTARVGWELFDPEREDRARNQRLSTSAELSYVLAPKHSVGGALVFSLQDFDDRVNIAASQTLSYGLRGQWLYRFDETTTFSINVGPSLLQTDQDDADALLTGQQLVPFVNVSGNVSGKTDVDGNPFSGPVGSDSIVVGNFDLCSQLGDGTPVIVSGACPLDIIIDSNGEQLLIDDIRAATTSLANSDPDGESDTSFNVFGELTLRKDWAPNLRSALTYSRQQGGASGLGGAVIRDAVSFSNTWTPSERWQFTARADWSLRESVVEQAQVVTQAALVDTTDAATFPTGNGIPVAVNIAGIAPDGSVTGSNITLRGDTSEIDTMRWGVSGRATHRFSRNTSGHIQLTYNQQESEGGTLGNSSDFENFLALVGVRYVFDPIKLW